MRQNLFDSNFWAPFIKSKLKIGNLTQELAASKTIDPDEGPVFFFTETTTTSGVTTTRDIALPDPSANPNLVLIAFNMGGPTTPPGMEFSQTTTTSADLVATVESGEGVILISNGSTWRALVGTTT